MNETRIRKACEADIPWMMGISRNAYDAGTFMEDEAIAYWRAVMGNENCILLRGEKALMGAMVASMPYNKSVLFGITLPIASSGNAAFELLAMTRQILEWAKGKGAKWFNFAATTGADLGPLAKRVGGKEVSPSYRVEL